MDFLCLEFANSSWYITHRTFSDPLKDNGWLKGLAEKYGMELPAPKADELSCLISMRSRLLQLFDKLLEEKKLPEADIAFLNDYMAAVSFHRELKKEKGSLTLCEIPDKHGWSWFMAEVASSFAALYTSEAADKLKVCQNPECRWLFIDESKSRNRKWCDDTCSTLMKVRRFRQKKKS
jgi:predicted RNA-binding Zn ribbon-like protein